MGKIRIDADALRSNSRTMEAKIQELNQLNQSLDALIRRIGDSWEGDASIAYIALMKSYEQKAIQMENVLREFKSYIDTVITRFEDMDQAAGSRLRGAF